MTRRLLVTGAALAAACASRAGAGGSTPAPVAPPPAAPAAAPVQPIAQPAGRRSDVIHYGPSALRYVVHRRLHIQQGQAERPQAQDLGDRKSTRLNSSHSQISYAVFCLKKKKKKIQYRRRQVETRDQEYGIATDI